MSFPPSTKMSTPRTTSDWSAIIASLTPTIESRLHEISTASDTASSVSIPQLVDHTQLSLSATAAQIDQLCREAWEWDFASVCVRKEWVPRCVDQLARYPTTNNSSSDGTTTTTGPLIACVIGFHEGDYPLEYKIAEITAALTSGAHELDVVLNYHHLLSTSYSLVYTELSTLALHAHQISSSQNPPRTVTLKLILETSRLSSSHIIAACILAGYAGWGFVKTSTGFHGHGAKVEHVRLMAACADVLYAEVAEREGERLGKKKMQVKASGGIRGLAAAKAMVAAGATRLGCSAGVKIAEEAGCVKRVVPEGIEGVEEVKVEVNDSSY